MENLLFKIVAGCFLLLGRVPRSAAVRTAGFLGRIWFVADKRHRNVALENLTHAFGAEKTRPEIRCLARQVFCHLVLMLFEIGWSLRLRQKDFFRFFRITGLQHLIQAHQRGKGVLILTGHVGNWELLTMAAAMLGYSMSAIYRPLDFKPLDRFFNSLRTRHGAVLYPKKNAMRPVLRALKKGELIGILLDQNARRRDGVFVDFFDRKAWTNKGLALIAQATEAPVVPLFLLRENHGFLVEFGPEIPTVRTGDKNKDVESNTRQYNRAIEDVIRRYPDQWFWVHERWKPRSPKTRKRINHLENGNANDTESA